MADSRATPNEEKKKEYYWTSKVVVVFERASRSSAVFLSLSTGLANKS